MNEVHLSEGFSSALRSVLTAQVFAESAAKKRRNRRIWLGAGIFAGAGLRGGVGAAAAGFSYHPGGDSVTTLSAPVFGTYSGTATVDLGTAPAGVTNLAVELTCLTPGRLVFDDGASIVCDAANPGKQSGPNGGYSIPLAPGQHTVTITTEPGASWAIKASYVQQTTTDWAVNSHGQSYGVLNANGAPDLVAVVASNGKTAYAHSKDLDDANGTAAATSFKSPEDALACQNANRGKTFSVPVYESDGTTRVGEFIVDGP